MTTIERELRCESCHEPHGGNIGDPCDEACQHSRVILELALGRRTIEISKGAAGGYIASGFVGENLSREFGVKCYVSVKNAERHGSRWLKLNVDRV